MEEVAKVYRTNDYGLFKKKKGNRKVSTNEKLKEEITKNGQLSPIVVNKNYEILDGQHRFSILKELNLPIMFFVNENAKNDNAIISMNVANRNWTNEDYLNYYTSKNNKEYEILSRLYYDNNFTLPLLICILSLKRKGSFTGKLLPYFKNGDFKIVDTTLLDDFKEFCEEVESETLLSLKSTTKDVLWTIYTTANFDADYFIEKVNTTGIANKVNLLRTPKDIITTLVLECYNKNLKSSKRKLKVDFDSDGSLLLKDKRYGIGE